VRTLNQDRRETTVPSVALLGEALLEVASTMSSQRLRDQAARARYYAQHAMMRADREAWLAIADRWEQLAEAEDLERRKEAGGTQVSQQQQAQPKPEDDKE
jgi:hypothetical protein